MMRSGCACGGSARAMVTAGWGTGTSLGSTTVTAIPAPAKRRAIPWPITPPPTITIDWQAPSGDSSVDVMGVLPAAAVTRRSHNSHVLARSLVEQLGTWPALKRIVAARVDLLDAR